MKRKSILSQVDSLSSIKSQIGQDWEIKDHSLERTFVFKSYEHANNFLVRYNSYCEKVNSTPQWSNVYNKVSVILQCTDVNTITHKEVSIAKYLNMVNDVSHDTCNLLDSCLYHHPNVSLSMENASNKPELKTMIEYNAYPRLQPF